MSVNDSTSGVPAVPAVPALRHITTVLLGDMRRRENFFFLALAVLLLAIFPLALDIFRLNLIGKYLTYAFVAVSLVLFWGNGGILSLGQGVFFGLGGYCMAMFLKLEASDPVATAIQSTPGIPDFMDWNQLTALPAFWVPFKSLSLTVAAILILPALFAFIIGVAMFKRRVGGVYFAIITQAVALILSVLIVGQQGMTGGINGITDLKTLHGWDIRTDSAKYDPLLRQRGAARRLLVAGSVSSCSSKLGRLLVAVRDREDRVRFTGYDVANFKTFVFVARRGVRGIGGAMFTLAGRLHVALVRRDRPLDRDGDRRRRRWSHVDVRCRLGTLLVNYGKTFFLRKSPGALAVLIGALFIAVVMVFPDGLAGDLFGRSGAAAPVCCGAQSKRRPAHEIADGVAAAECGASSLSVIEEFLLRSRV